MLYADMSKDELLKLKSEVTAQYDEMKAKGLKLDMSRGKPNVEQLNLSMGMMDALSGSELAATTVYSTVLLRQSVF